MPPSSTSDASSSYSTSTQRELDRLEKTKADREASRIRHEEFEKDIGEAKAIALSAKKTAQMPHACYQEARMNAVEQKAASWDRWFKGVVATLLLSIISVGSFLSVVYYQKADVAVVAEVTADVSKIKGDVSEIQESQERIETALAPEEQLRLEAKRLALIKEALKEVVLEATRVDQDPPRRINRHP